MKNPWVNTILLLVLLAQAVSGYLGMINNEQSFRWVLWLHGVGAYAIVVLLYWKATVIFDAVRRKTVWTRQRVLFMVTLLLLLGTLALGIAWTFGGAYYFLRISGVSWHIYLSIPLMGLMLWHAWQMRFVLRIKAARDRGVFVKTAVFATAGLILWQVGKLTQNALPLPGAARRFTGSYPRGLADGRFPVTSWIADNPAPIDAADWQLTISGAVQTPLQLSYAQLRQRATATQTATLDCTGGWYTTQPWRGVLLGELLDEAGVLETAVSVTVESITGYKRRYALRQASGYILALDMRDAPLTHGHGFPLRLIAHNKRGVEWVKWITAVRVNTTSAVWQSPLPLQ